MIPVAYPLLVAAPTAALAAFCSMHIVCSRWIGSRSPYLPIILGFSAGMLFLVAVSLGLLHTLHPDTPDVLGLLGLNVATYLALAFGYFAFVNLNLTSLRIRILAELLEHDGVLATSTLVSGYSADHVAEMRLERLVAARHLVQRGEQFYRRRSRFFLLAGAIAMLRAFILGQARQSKILLRAESDIATIDPKTTDQL